LARSAVVRATVVATGTVRVDVTLPRIVERALHVQGADGRPAASVTAELIDFTGQPAQPEAEVMTIGEWRRDYGIGLLVPRGATDANGDLRLHGAEGQRVALRLSGAGHPRVLVDDALREPSPLVVTLPAGARLDVRLGPAALVRQLRSDNELPVEGPAARG